MCRLRRDLDLTWNQWGAREPEYLIAGVSFKQTCFMISSGLCFLVLLSLTDIWRKVFPESMLINSLRTSHEPRYRPRVS